MGLNRISWKRRNYIPQLRKLTLPMGLNRISWKPFLHQAQVFPAVTLPMGLNRISWKPVPEYTNSSIGALPMGLNRISWKLLQNLP